MSFFVSKKSVESVLLTTITFLIIFKPSVAFLTFDRRGIFFPPLIPSLAVITIDDSQSLILSLNYSGAKPPNTTECIAPILEQANIAKAASGIMGR